MLAAMVVSLMIVVLGSPAYADTSDEPGFWLAYGQGTTFEDAVRMASHYHDRDVMQVVLEGMLAHAERGQAVSLPGSSPAGAATDAQRIRLLLEDVGEGPELLDSQADQSPDSSIMSDPSNFPIRGSSANSGYSWRWQQFWVEGAYCGFGGCTVTDRITTNVTTDPGAWTTRANATLLYSPNSGNFSGAVFSTWTLRYTWQDVAGFNVSPTNHNATGEMGPWFAYLWDNKRVPGYGWAAHAHELDVHFAPWGQDITDSSKTGQMQCEPPSLGERCRYGGL